MYAGKDFSPADQVESEIYSFDFVKDCASGETIASATWTCQVADDSEGTDGSASSRVSGSSSNDGTVTSQRIVGLRQGVKYVLQAVVVTNQSNTRSLWAHVECVEPK
jgi:hypothetical protein